MIFHVLVTSFSPNNPGFDKMTKLNNYTHKNKNKKKKIGIFTKL